MVGRRVEDVLGDLGAFSDELVHEPHLRAAFTLIKLKVGSDVADDVRRMKVARAAVGDGVRIAVDAN